MHKEQICTTGINLEFKQTNMYETFEYGHESNAITPYHGNARERMLEAWHCVCTCIYILVYVCIQL